MKGINASTTNPVLADQSDFSLALGGPLYQLYLRTNLVRPAFELLLKRIVAISLFCWTPLFLLSLAAGHAVGGVTIPFLFDLGVHTRFLVAVPLLIGAEPIVHQRMKSIVEQFFNRGIVCPGDRTRFEAIVGSAMRLRNSIFAEVCIFLFAIGIGNWAWQQNVVVGPSSWYAVKGAGPLRLTVAGFWYAFVSLTVLRFLILRWFFRLFIWYRLLWQVRGLPLHLNLFHPDRAGGLGFLGGSALAFSPVLISQTVILSGIIGERIWHAGARLPTFKIEILGTVVFLILLVLLPLVFFTPQLEEAHRLATREYGILASRYVDDFYHKWIRKNGDSVEPLLGTPDLQSLADLGNTYAVVSRMRLLPLSKETVLRLTILVILPLVPLTLTMVPLDALVEKAVRLVL